MSSFFCLGVKNKLNALLNTVIVIISITSTNMLKIIYFCVVSVYTRELFLEENSSSVPQKDDFPFTN